IQQVINHRKQMTQATKQLLSALNPEAIMRRGYAIVRSNGKAVRTVNKLAAGGIVDVQLADGGFQATVKEKK
ncbi:MAG TPA: exodeoxyribonuclease VII large subunit, partial [Methylomirabilota bacterium]|nr:exodeoxyribonuclease VII large subunit [Methylomirabilota bacterium]